LRRYLENRSGKTRQRHLLQREIHQSPEYHPLLLNFRRCPANFNVVNNAGIGGPKSIPDSTSASELKDKLWEAESFEGWASVMNTNVSSVYFTTVAFLPLLQACLKNGFAPRSPSVIVISSM